MLIYGCVKCTQYKGIVCDKYISLFCVQMQICQKTTSCRRYRTALSSQPSRKVEDVLKGDNAKAVLILLDQVYGTVLELCTLLKNFYVAEQGEEKPSDFLNHLYLQIQLQQVGAVSKTYPCTELVQQFVSGMQ